MQGPSDSAGAASATTQRPGAILVRAGAGGVVLAATAAVAVDGVPDWEVQLFEVLNGGPGGIEYALWAPMQAGSLFGPFVVGGLAWWRWRNWRPALGSVLAGVVAWQLAKVVKAAVDRGRPYELLEEFSRRMGTPQDGLGFVSGHSAVAFCLAAVCSPYLSRKARILAYVLASVVGLARIQVSAHLPLDVIGGAALGYGFGQLWNFGVGVPSRWATASEGPPEGAGPPG